MEAFVLFYAATFLPHKNHRVLIEALEFAALVRPKIRVVCTISLDDLPIEMRERAERLVELGLLDLVGWVDGSDLESQYARCDACVVPSILESLSSAHIEAMAWGKPIVTADLPYARDICGDAAMFVEPSSAKSWAEAMLEVSSDQGLRVRLARQAARRVAIFPASWDEVATLAEQYLESVVR